eukprot:CAMPEP_0119541422 /NCGR_PEP_ID=MMETSP1344-20130328/52951_1 /TAXON_ID=236787 /ORGANISM="Florenciella parvula, Strain CCMP2471" /LENGTH=77 /DNA_ID=CAMNT_0007585395 /DNA_START=382 /DNA_END=610 /DNA_ORIENTATION=+
MHFNDSLRTAVTLVLVQRATLEPGLAGRHLGRAAGKGPGDGRRRRELQVGSGSGKYEDQPALSQPDAGGGASAAPAR